MDQQTQPASSSRDLACQAQAATRHFLSSAQLSQRQSTDEEVRVALSLLTTFTSRRADRFPLSFFSRSLPGKEAGRRVVPGRGSHVWRVSAAQRRVDSHKHAYPDANEQTEGGTRKQTTLSLCLTQTRAHTFATRHRLLLRLMSAEALGSVNERDTERRREREGLLVFARRVPPDTRDEQTADGEGGRVQQQRRRRMRRKGRRESRSQRRRLTQAAATVSPFHLRERESTPSRLATTEPGYRFSRLTHPSILASHIHASLLLLLLLQLSRLPDR